MAVKVTGQFVPAGDFSIVDAKDISGNITASNFSGSADSTGSFGHLVVQGNITASGTVRADAFESVTGGNAISFNDSLNVSGNVTASGDLSIDDLTASGRVTATSFGGVFEGALSSSAQIASNISGAFAVASASFASDINDLQTDSGSFSTRVTRNEGTGSKILTGQLDFTDITATGAITASGGLQATTGNIKTQNSRRLQAFRNDAQYVELYSDPNGFNYLQPFGGALRFAPNGGTKMILHTNGRLGLNTTTDAGFLLDINGTSRLTGDVTLGADISGSATSTGSFGHGNFDGNVGIGTKSPSKKLEVFKSSEPRIRVTSGNSGNPAYEWAVNNDRKWVFYSAQHLGTNTMYFKTNTTNIMALKQDGDVGIGNDNPSFKLDVGGTGRFTGTLTTAAITTTGITSTGNISGSATSTASFGHFIGDGSGLENVFEGTVPSASISTRLTNLKTDSGSFSTRVTDLKTDSGSFSTRVTNLKTDSGSFSTRVTNLKADSGSFSTRVTNLKTDSGSFSTRITNLKADSGSFSTRVTKNEGTGSKILNGQLEFTNITASGNLSIGGVSVFDSHITASGRVNLDGKVFIQTGSIEGDLHVRTNENLMRIGKSTSGVIVSGSGAVSRFVTGSDGSIIDLGFTVTDEDGNVVLAGDGDGIHVDSNNYWYNNKYYRVGDARNDFLNFNPNVGIKYSGEVIAQTGSFGGEMFINSPTGSMFIGKFTGGIPSSGSDNVSRFATGSDGSIIDLGFTTTNEEGETVFLTTGDGIVRDSENYWYTTGHFKVGNGEKQIEWNTTDLNVSASTVDVTTLKASDVNFAGLPTSDPLVTGSLWVSGSSSSGSYKSGFVMISGIHG